MYRNEEKTRFVKPPTQYDKMRLHSTTGFLHLPWNFPIHPSHSVKCKHCVWVFYSMWVARQHVNWVDSVNRIRFKVLHGNWWENFDLFSFSWVGAFEFLVINLKIYCFFPRKTFSFLKKKSENSTVFSVGDNFSNLSKNSWRLVPLRFLNASQRTKML